MIRHHNRRSRRANKRARKRIVVLHVNDVGLEVAQQTLRCATRSNRHVHVAIQRGERNRSHLHHAHTFRERKRLSRDRDRDLVTGGGKSAREVARENARSVSRTERLSGQKNLHSFSAASPKCRSRHANATPATSGSQKFTPRKIIVAVIAFCFAMPRDAKTSVMTPSTTATPCGIGLTMKKTMPIPNAAMRPPSGTSIPNA